MLRDTIPGNKGGSTQQFKYDPVTGLLLFYDQIRIMYLSVDRESFKFGIDHRNISSPMWMSNDAGNSLVNSYLIPRNGLITRVTVSTQNLSNCIFRIRSLVSGPDLTTISLTGQSSKTNDNLSINLIPGNYLRILADVTSGNIDFPILSIEVAWR